MITYLVFCVLFPVVLVACLIALAWSDVTRAWKWVRLGWTGVLGYKTTSGNRVRLYIAGFDPDDDLVVITWKNEPGEYDIRDLTRFLSSQPQTIWRIPRS